MIDINKISVTLHQSIFYKTKGLSSALWGFSSRRPSRYCLIFGNNGTTCLCRFLGHFNPSISEKLLVISSTCSPILSRRKALISPLLIPVVRETRAAATSTGLSFGFFSTGSPFLSHPPTIMAASYQEPVGLSPFQ